jgi:hypothetical protein
LVFQLKSETDWMQVAVDVHKSEFFFLLFSNRKYY